MKNLSIKAKLLATIVVSLLIVSIVLLSQMLFSINNTSDRMIEQSEESVYSIKEKEVENYVSLAYKTLEIYHRRTNIENVRKEVAQYLENQTNLLFSILEGEYEKNKDILPEKELKRRLKSIIRSTRFEEDNSGYFYAFLFDGTTVVHGQKPSLEGKNLIGLKDPKGFLVIKKIVEIGEKHKNGGTFSYLWPKKASEEPEEKVSYVKTFTPYNWAIGTGAYAKDINEKIKADALKAVEEMRYGDNGYYWINNSNHEIVAHGIKKSLIGKNLKDVTDKRGKYIYQEFVKTANKNKNGGIVKYHFTKPGEEGEFEKISYVKKFAPWDLIVGTGTYVTDLENTVNKMKQDTKKYTSNAIINSIIMALVLTLLVVSSILFIMKKIILNPLTNFQKGLLGFFSYLNKETDTVKELNVKTNDEIGIMANAINENINKTKKLIEEDNLILEDVKRVVSDAKIGNLSSSINKSTSNTNLEELKKNFNEMLSFISSNVSNDLNSIQKSLEQLQDLNFTHRIKDPYGKTSEGINALAEIINTMLVENKSNGLTLENSANVLMENVEMLTTSSNETAASLEETAAALEEITSTIVNNSENVAKLSEGANKLSKSAMQGQELAQNATNAMDDITEQVTLINESISVIDQIAFQTNILSLNAAVEAATAGEAGKGFAVVAQEVRNLAARSAEAAKEIKELVENATLKASYGKETSAKMIDGYNGLLENINDAAHRITEISNASKEQESGITQINDAVTQLDEQTQQNAQVATQTQDIANDTLTIAQNIVKDANEKDFIGKETVQMKTLNNTASKDSLGKVKKESIKKTNDSATDNWENF